MPYLLRRRPFMLGALASILPPVHAQIDGSRLSAAVRSAFEPLMSSHDVPGMAVGVTVAGKQHTFTFGVASRETGSLVTADTLFEIGSLSKTFTATLAAYAQALGRLSMQDSPARTMPALRGTAIEKANLLQLGTYTAGGLPLQFPDDVRDEAEALAFYRSWTPAASPGTQRRYSNPSIGLLGHIAALAMQRDFAELSEKELFPKLGLRRTFIRVGPSQLPSYASGYNKANQPIRVNPGVFDAQAYGVKTTVQDMLTFLDANIDPSSLEPALRRAVADTHIGHFRVGAMVQGLGWEQYPFPLSLSQLQEGNASTMALDPHAAHALPAGQGNRGETLFNKTGSTNGFGAYAAFVPSRRVGIVMLANRNVPILARIEAAHRVLRQVTAT